MEIWLWDFCTFASLSYGLCSKCTGLYELLLIAVLILIIAVLLIKIYLLRKSAKEIKEAFADRLDVDTNTLITISSHDRSMRELADSINVQLRKLRKQRHLFSQGDLSLKEAVTNISHDLRTPLTAICGYLDLLEREETSETVTRYLDVIKNRTEVLTQLTEELFHYSLATSAIRDIPMEDVVLNHVLEESISAHYAVLTGCHITPDISIPDQNIIRHLNKHALLRIFENILNNAMKYSDGDLQITLSEHGEIRFSNHASQLSEVQVQKLFDRLYTVETAEKSTGLGLSIAKTLTEQMSGTITARYLDGILSIAIYFSEP